MINQQKVGAIIMAAGSSQWMGGLDKVFALLGGKLVLGLLKLDNQLRRRLTYP